MSNRADAFDSFSEHALAVVRTPYAFVIALALVGAWVAFGFQVGFTNTFYQLLINTGTTIVTFLLGFLILYNGHKQAIEAHQEQLERHAEILREIHGLHAQDDGR